MKNLPKRDNLLKINPLRDAQYSALRMGRGWKVWRSSRAYKREPFPHKLS